MSRMTKEERDMLAALSERATAEDQEDDATEVWVRNDKGHEVKLVGAKARTFLSQFGIDDDEGKGDDGDQGDGDDGDQGDKKPAGGGYFAKRKS
jgi:hypothetical protein